VEIFNNDTLLIHSLVTSAIMLLSQLKEAQHMNWREYIESTPDVLRGKPGIKGTRIPVSLILGYRHVSSISL